MVNFLSSSFCDASNVGVPFLSFTFSTFSSTFRRLSGAWRPTKNFTCRRRQKASSILFNRLVEAITNIFGISFIPPINDNNKHKISTLYSPVLSFLLGANASTSSIAIQQKRCGNFYPRWKRDNNNFSVSPTLERFNSVLEIGATTSSIPAFLQTTSHKTVFPVPGGPHLKNHFLKINNIIIYLLISFHDLVLYIQ